MRAGITTVDHGSVLDDEIVQEMKKRGTWFVPTMMAFDGVMKLAKSGKLPPGPTKKALAIEPMVRESHSRAIRAGVRGAVADCARLRDSLCASAS